MYGLTVGLTVGDAIAKQVKWYRRAADLTQDELAARTEAFGLPLNRATIAKIEAGSATTRAAGATITDVISLALALNVPPILLIAPLGTVDEDVSTGRLTTHVDLFRRWFAGHEGPSTYREGELRPRSVGDHDAFRRHSQVIRLFDRLNEIHNELTAAYNRQQSNVDAGITGPDAESVTRRVDRLLRMFDEHHRRMRDAGLEVPEVAAGWANRMMALRDMPEDDR